MTQNDLLIEIKNLKTHFFTDEGIVRAVDGVDMEIYRNKTLCVVGESGCGKSITARSILQIVDPPGRVVEGEMLYHRRSENGQEEVIDLAALHPRSRLIRDIRGKDISMIFQEPMTSLNPVMTIGGQIAEAVRLHQKVSRRAALARAAEMLDLVRIPDVRRRLSEYPHQLSGGMRQRVMIAMA
ncbi:MAG: ABC transporter ATP-binding protein, partial [Caldilineaceae bacterium]|nr:ABC transporter ATP-binding protein [Caldilineaceae bacterium]